MASHLRHVRRTLETLQESNEPSEAVLLLNDIRSNFEISLSGTEIGIFYSLIFSGSESLLNLSKKLVRRNEFAKCQESCILLFQEVIPQMGQALFSYMKGILDTCFYVFQAARLSSIKEKTLEVIILLIKAQDTHHQELDINSIRKLCNEELAKRSGTTSSVKSCCFHLLGLLAQHYPEEMTDHSERLFDIYLRELKREFRGSSDLKLIEGCLQGLCCLMLHFTKSVDEDSEACAEIFKYTIISIQPKSDLSRYAVPTAGLQMIQRHASQFGHLLIDQCEVVYAALQKWFNHRNSQMRHEAHLAIVSLLKQVVMSVDDEMASERAKRLFMYFTAKFRETLESGEASSKAVSLAIQGFGLFAGSCRKYMPSEYIQKMLDVMMDKSTTIYLGSEVDKDGDNQLHQMPGFLFSLANIVKELNTKPQVSLVKDDSMHTKKFIVTDVFQRSLCLLSVRLIKGYPQLNKKFSKSCYSSLVHLMAAFSSCPDSQKVLLSEISKLCAQLYNRKTENPIADLTSSLGRLQTIGGGLSGVLVSIRVDRTCHNVSLELEKFFHKRVFASSESGHGSRDITQQLFWLNEAAVYQGLIRCCSTEAPHILNKSSGEMTDLEKDSRMQTNKDYVSLWKGLICGQRSEFSTPLSSRNTSDYVSTQKLIFSEVLISIVKIASKLHLSSKTEMEATVVGQEEEEIMEAETLPENIIDLRIFNNFCELCTKLLPVVTVPEEVKFITRGIFLSHVNWIVKSLIKASTCHPNVPGFYELLSAIMGICVEVEYFSCFETLSLRRIDDIDEPVPGKTTSNYIKILVRKFAQEVTSRMTLWKDDVVQPSLLFILSLPCEIARDILDILVQPLQLSFRLGLSSTALAGAAMDAILRWRDPAESSLPLPFLSVLPDLEPYLHDVLSKESTNHATLISRRKRGRRIQQQESPTDDESSLSNKLQIRDRVIKFLGSIGGTGHYCLDSGSTETVGLEATAAVRYAIPFQELKIDLQLDSFLSRIGELALRSVSRQTRITSCELLHSLTVYIIGKSAHQDEAIQHQHPMTKIYESIVPVILQLACDIEPVCNQLFAPLVMQMVHWLTKNKKYESPDMAAFLNAVMDGLVDEINGALRDFCASITKEFLIWSIKQDVGSDSTSRKNAKSLFKRLYSLAKHSSSIKRMGSALAFNQIYSVFREQETLVDEFTFELLVTFIDSLSIAQDDDDALGTQRASTEVLQHIKRIVMVKSDLLNKESKIRRTPSDFSTSVPVTVDSVARWLLDQCGRSQTECRHVCMDLLHSFVPLIPGNRPLTLWLKEFIDSNGIARLTACFEGGPSRTGIAFYPQIALNLKDSKLESGIHWLDLFLTSLDCYTWLIQQRLLMPSQIFESSGTSKFFNAVDFFLHDVVYSNMDEILGESGIYTPFEYEKFNEKKCTVIVRILQFTSLMFRRFPEQSLQLFPKEILKAETLLGVVATCTANPSSLGFNIDADLTIAEQLPALVNETITSMLKNFPKDLRNKFIVLLRMEVAKNGTLLEQLASVEDMPDAVAKCTQLLSAYKILAKNKVFTAELPEHKVENLDTEKMLLYVFNSVVSKNSSNFLILKPLTQQWLEMGNKLLDLTLLQGVAEDLLFRHITNDTVVHSDAQEELTTRHGQLFFTTYKSVLCGEMCSKSSTYVRLLLQQASDSNVFTINEMLEHLFAQRDARKKYSSVLCGNILKYWSENKEAWNMDRFSIEAKSMHLTLYTKVISMESKVCEPNHPFYGLAFELFERFITSTRLSLRHKLQILPVASLFATAADENRQNSVKSVLFELVSQHFPTHSEEFARGSTSYEDYISALQKLLFSLELTGNSAILEVLIAVFCNEDNHALGEEFQGVLERCMQNVAEVGQQALLDKPYNLFADSQSPHQTTVKCRIVDFVVLPLLTHAASNTVRQFFISHIGEIMKCLVEDQKRTSPNEWRDQLAAKSCCYRLSAKMFSLLPADQFKLDSSPLVQSFSSSPVGAGSTKFLKTFLGRAVRDKNEDIADGSELLEERRLFHCAVYNAIISAVMCTQTEAKWFDVFVFCDNPKKKEYLFDNIIDKNKVYIFPVQTENLQRKKIIAVRGAFREASKVSKLDYESVVYASSLVGSSLSEDADRFDSNLPHPVQHRRQESELTEADGETEDIIEVENDTLNNHECMQDLIRLITHMKSKGIGFLSVDDSGRKSDQPIPKWMSTVIQKLDSTSHLNLKIFIAKLIVNCESAFRQFAASLLAPLMRVVLAYLKKHESDEAIDQFVIDVVVMILSWSPFTMPKDDTEDKILVRAVIEGLMRNVKHENQSVSRRNLDLIKTAVECWHDRITELNTDIVFHQCCGTDPKSLDNFVGLCLLEALLANGIQPYALSVEVDRSVYFQRIFGNMLSSRKAIVDLASKVMGMALKHLSLVQNEVDGEIHNLARGVLEKRSTSSKSGVSGLGVFISSLHKVASHYPPAAEAFVEQVLFNMPKLPGAEIKICCVDILHSCINKMENPIVDLRAKGFLSMLTHRDDGLQHSCLKLCGALLRNTVTWEAYEGPYNHEDIKCHKECVAFVFPTIGSKFPNHPSKLCRQELYEIAMFMYDVQTGFPEQHQSLDTLNIVKRILLHGLLDEEEATRMRVVNFYSEEVGKGNHRLPIDPAGKTLSILKDWYQPGIDEVGFLSSFCNLLMQTTSRSPDFLRPIFDNPLSECVFQEFTFDQSGYGGTYAVLQTLVPSVASSSVGNPAVSDDMGIKRRAGPGMLQATQQNFEFSATVSTFGAGKNTYNWMTGDSVDTFSDLSGSRRMQTSSTSGTSSSRKVIRPRKAIGADFRKQFQRADDQDEEVLNLDRLKRRFLKDTSTNFQYARIAVERKKKQSIKHAASRRQKNAVQMYRSYRVGELPDIQIPHSGLITPMAALTQNDPLFLRRFMSTMIHGLTKEQLKTSKNPKFVDVIASAFTHVLSSSQQCDSTLVGFVLDVIQQNPSSFNISPSVLSKAAMKANLQSLGIRAIEEWLIHQEVPKEPASKRKKLMVQSHSQPSDTEILAWIELARLYQKDIDTLRGIFAGSPIARSLFSKAVCHEGHGEYGRALKIYQEALAEQMHPEPSDIEKDLWEDCLLNCLKKLGRWQEVNKFCDSQTDDYPRSVWTDDHFQQRFLSTSIHSKIILLLQGDNDVRDELISFFESTTSPDGDREKMMEKQYPEYRAILHIHKEEYESAHHYLHKATDAFAASWSKTDTLSLRERHNSLSKLLHLSDMRDFLDIMRKNKDLTAPVVNELLEQWSNRLPHAMYDNFSAWEDMVNYRGYFLDQLYHCVSATSAMDCDSEDDQLVPMQRLLAKKQLDFTLIAANEACKRRYFALSRKLLNQEAEQIIQRLKTLDGNDTAHSEENTQLCLSMASYYLGFAHQLMSNNRESDFSTASKAILASYNVLKETLQDEKVQASQIKLSALLGRTFELAEDALHSHRTGISLPAHIEEIVASECGQSDNPRDALTEIGKRYLHQGISQCPENGDCVDENVTQIYMTYARFCDKLLQKKQNSDSVKSLESPTSSRDKDLAKTVVKYALRTMNFRDGDSGSEASLKFPRLLQLIEAYPGEAKTCFLDETTKLPAWIFLRWINQMTALLDKREADAIHGIVRRLAVAYPQAVIYPVKTSFTDFEFGRDEIGRRNRSFVERLHSDLDEKIPVVQLFIKNLTLLISPAHAFKEWYEDTIQILRRKDKTGLHKLVLTKYQNMYNEFFASHKSYRRSRGDSAELSSDGNVSTSLYWNDFAKKFKAEIDNAFGGPTGGQGLLDEKKFFQAVRKISNQMNEYCRTRRPQTLKEYSKWLFDFHSLKLDRQELEIPGQYTGYSKPRPGSHIKIASFEDSVCVMSSLQQPKKITIKASDCKDYQFLVKGNEDLRQDQRIQQLFEMMNISFQQEPLCAERMLHINTYRVVPVTSRLGLIEWVDKTKTLNDIICEESKQINKSACLDEAAQAYGDWLGRYGNPKKMDVMYGNMVKMANYTEVHNKYSDVVSRIPRGLLRNAYLRLSPNPEHFLTLRQNFSLSYGAMCIAHWILGIGDRHTSNCMISLKTGEAVGIDFGHAFGTATEVLAVPELMPFRLSPQLCYLMAPHPAKHGPLRQSMLLCLDTLRSNRETILAMLDVFLKEPSVDWLKHANKMLQVHGSGISNMDSTGKQSWSDSSSASRSAAEWYALRKIELVRKKLTGSHPSHIVQDELRHNFRISQAYLPHYMAAATGAKGKCLRVDKDKEELSTDEQVDVLIDLATDPNVVGRSYFGWRYWI